MNVKELIRYLNTQDSHAEVTVFDGFREFTILDIYDSQIILNTEPNRKYQAKDSPYNQKS